MTSRVQKGGAVFKPSVKVRARTAAPSAETRSKNPENGLSEASAPSISAIPLASSASTSSIPPPQASFFPDPQESISTASTVRSVYPARNTALPPSISASVTPKPPSITRTIPSTSFSSFNRLGPPSVPIAHPPVSAINVPNSFATTSFTGSNTVSLPSQQPATFPVVDRDAQDAFSTPFGRGFSLESLGGVMSHDAFLSSLAHSSIESDPMSLTAPGLSAIDPQLHPILSGNLVLHKLRIRQCPSITSGAETDSKSKKRGRPKKNAAVTEDQQETEEGDGVKSTRKGSRRGKKAATGQDGQKPVRKRKSSQAAADDSGSDAETSPPAKKRKRSSGSQTPRPRKKRSPSLPPYDPDADPGEEIDPTVVTMAFLCEDPGFGRVSSKALEIQSSHAAWKARNKEKRARLRALMEKKKYGLDENEAMAKMLQLRQPLPKSHLQTKRRSRNGKWIRLFQDLTTSRYNVQVRIGPNGETIIDETSLTVDRDENHATENYTHIVESDTSKFTNSGTYGKRFRGSRWSADETELFYDALAQYGENYELIAFVLPGRDRKSCKNKFKAEDKKNPARINFVLNNSKPVDMDTLSRMTGKDFSGPVPEIVAPPIPVIVAPSAPEPDASLETALPVRKRSQSRRRALADDVQIVGQVGDFVDPDDPSM
ncbi:hypothetical protein BDZ89DRAFT_1129076 [Hymenopellis radicata]|nr:hypothetical protein BDZ89DRAFT_1129076 [Hymenopellis radicata]